MITSYSVIVNPAALGRRFEVVVHADLIVKDLATVEAFEDPGGGYGPGRRTAPIEREQQTSRLRRPVRVAVVCDSS